MSFLAQFFLRLLEARRLGGTPLHHHDDVPAELRVHWLIRHLAGLHREGGGREFGHHLILLEEPQVAALLRRARILAVLLGQRRKVPAALQIGDDLLRLVFVVDQDVLRMHLFLAGLAGDVLVIAGMQRGIGDRRPHLLAQDGGLQRTIFRRGHLPLHGRVLVEARLARGGNQRPLIDHLIEQHGVQRHGRQAAHVVRQPLHRILQVAQMDRLAVHLGYHRIRRRSCSSWGWGGLSGGGLSGGGLRLRGHGTEQCGAQGQRRQEGTVARAGPPP